jgi:hypothetical protein
LIVDDENRQDARQRIILGEVETKHHSVGCRFEARELGERAGGIEQRARRG